jgi:hypothetical protein
MFVDYLDVLFCIERSDGGSQVVMELNLSFFLGHSELGSFGVLKEHFIGSFIVLMV